MAKKRATKATKKKTTTRKRLPARFEPERIVELLAARYVLSPARLTLAKKISRDLARDPALLKSIERVLKANGARIEKLKPTVDQLRSFGWTERELAMPSPKQAAAAAAAGAAAMAAACVPVPV